MGGRKKQQQVEAGGSSPWGAAARPWVTKRREDMVRNWRRRAKNPTKQPRLPGSQPKGDDGDCSLCPCNEEG